MNSNGKDTDFQGGQFNLAGVVSGNLADLATLSPASYFSTHHLKVGMRIPRYFMVGFW